MDGIELLARSARTPSARRCRWSSSRRRGSEDDRRRGIEAGADAYIVKDEFDQRALLETVERLVAR